MGVAVASHFHVSSYVHFAECQVARRLSCWKAACGMTIRKRFNSTLLAFVAKGR